MPITPADGPHYYESRNDERGCVYFVVADAVSMVKIGTTRNLEQRLIDIRVASPCILRVVYHRPGGRRLEAEYHKRFAAYWSHGEWFRIDGELRDFIEVMSRQLGTSAAAQMQPHKSPT